MSQQVFELIMSSSMRVTLSAVFLVQTIALHPALADDRSRYATTLAKTDDLEKAFWACDYAGTNGMVGPDHVVTCIAITDDLKRKKFDGDFDRLFAWWKVNKIARHQELDAISTSAIEYRNASAL